MNRKCPDLNESPIGAKPTFCDLVTGVSKGKPWGERRPVTKTKHNEQINSSQTPKYSN